MGEHLTVSVDMDLCQGYANCVLAAPDVFDVDEAAGRAILLEARPSIDRRDAVKEAARNCPMQAIIVEG